MSNKLKKILRIVVYAGTVSLGLLAIAAFVVMILSLRNICDYLSVSSSVFVAAISSVLTIAALMLTVESNNKKLSMQSKKILNGLRSSLSLKSVEINKCLQPKEITRTNKCAKDGEKNNFRILLRFGAADISELSNAVIKDFVFQFLYGVNITGVAGKSV